MSDQNSTNTQDRQRLTLIVPAETIKRAKAKAMLNDLHLWEVVDQLLLAWINGTKPYPLSKISKKGDE